MNLFYKLLLVFLISILSVSCTSIEIPLEEEPEPISELVKYNNDVKTIIDSNCLNCHGVSTPRTGRIALYNFIQVKREADVGSLISRMNNSIYPMPPSGKLSAQKLAIIDKWKLDGFLEN